MTSKPCICLCAALTLALPSLASAALPFHTSFSQEEGFFAGSAPGGGWVVQPRATVVATDHSIQAGQSVLLYQGRPPGFLQRGFAPNGSEIVFVDLFVRPAAGDVTAESTRIRFDSVGVAFLQSEGEATIAVTDISPDGRADWIDLGYPIPIDSLARGTDWTRITLRLDYGVSADQAYYDIYVDGMLMEYDLAFQPRRFQSGRTLEIVGALAAETWVDYIYAGEENPLFEDHGTGIPEEWLLSEGPFPDPGARFTMLADGRLAIDAYLDQNLAETPNRESRGRVLESGRRTSDRRLAVFTRLEKPDPEIQALIQDFKDQ
jgi:hypothetical protein